MKFGTISFVTELKTYNFKNMDKKEAQDLVKVLSNLVTVLKEHNKYIDKQNQSLRDNTEAIKELRTRLGSVANAITSGGSIVNS